MEEKDGHHPATKRPRHSLLTRKEFDQMVSGYGLKKAEKQQLWDYYRAALCDEIRGDLKSRAIRDYAACKRALVSAEIRETLSVRGADGGFNLVGSIKRLREIRGPNNLGIKEAADIIRQWARDYPDLCLPTNCAPKSEKA